MPNKKIINNKSDNTWVWITAIVVVLFLVFFGSLGMGRYGMMSMMYGTYGYSMMFFGWIVGILIIILIIAAIYWLVKTANRK